MQLIFEDMTKPLQSPADRMIIICRYDQAIVITRSPYAALIAEFHRQNQTGQYYESGHTEWANESLFYTKGRLTLLFYFSMLSIMFSAFLVFLNTPHNIFSDVLYLKYIYTSLYIDLRLQHNIMLIYSIANSLNGILYFYIIYINNIYLCYFYLYY